MNEIINKKGTFWIENEETKFEGIVKYENSHFYLTCDLSDYSNYIPKINGKIEDIPLLLSDCHYSYKLKDKVTFMCETIFKNYDDDKLLFNNARFEYNNLNHWIQYPFIGIDGIEDLLENFGDENSISGEDFEIALTYEKTSENLLMPYNFRFEIHYYDTTPSDKILKDCETIKDLLSLLMYQKANIHEITLINNDEEIKILSSHLKPMPPNVNPRNNLLELYEISENFLNILLKWFDNYKLINPTLYLYFINTASNHNAESLLIAYTQALEAYMRKTDHIDKFYMTDEEYETFKNKYHKWINGVDIPDGFKNSLNTKIKFGNEYSFRKRIKLLLKHFKEYDLVNHLNDKYEKNFTDIVIDTRNYYTHYSEKRNYVKTMGELVVLCYDIKLLLELCILYELGISKETIDSRLKEKYNPIKILPNYK